MPTISVIVPIYNVEKCFPRCIDSILCQSFDDFELILVDEVVRIIAVRSATNTPRKIAESALSIKKIQNSLRPEMPA